MALSFKLDRASRVTLADQLADGIRKDILGGVYRPGDVLPTLHELAAELGVSLRIPREAIEKLTNEGLLNPRQRVGSVVLGRGSSVWKGRVLMVQTGADVASYHETMLVAEFRRRMLESGYLFERFALSRNPRTGGWNRRDAAVLDMLLGQSLDLCVTVYDDSRLFRLLARRGIPFVAVDSARKRLRGCRSIVRHDPARAIGEFVAHCREAAVETVVQFDFADHEGFDAVPQLTEAGIVAERVNLPPVGSAWPLEGIRRGAYEGMRRFLRKRRNRLPDLALFADDFVANGALLALAECGVDVPREMRVVSFANVGNSPLYVKPLTMFVNDPVFRAKRLAEHVLGVLRGDFSRGADIGGLTYVTGETFAAS